MEIGKLLKTEIVKEMKRAYLDYAMSVIVSRALPDVRDGLKPVHRRILFGMHEMGLLHTSKFTKSAKIVGEVMGKFHPHGDAPIYDSLVRLAQDFSMRYPLIDGQGNFGCFTKDTKVRLTDGRSISFGDLIKEKSEGKKHWTYSFNTKLNRIEIAEIKNPRLTRKNAELVEVTLDNGKMIRCTPDHRFLLKNGKYKEAKNLKKGDSLMPFYTQLYDGSDKNLQGYEQIYQPTQENWEFAHHLADLWNLEQNVYNKSAGRIRHHLDINKLNNNPNNILRLNWKENWQIHYMLSSWRHKNDPQYVKKLAEGRKKYIENNHDLLSARASKRNKKQWQNSKFRKKQILRLKTMWKYDEYRQQMTTLASSSLKKRWEEDDFKLLMSKLKSKELKKRWKSTKYREKMSLHMKQVSLKLWSDPNHRKKISEIMKKISSNPQWKIRQSNITKALWKNSEYRSKFSSKHFSEMTKTLWKNEDFRTFHQEKTKKMWKNSEFRSKFARQVRASNKKRLEETPNMMRELTEYAKVSLKKKWQDPKYKAKVLSTRILRYVSSLNSQYKEVTPSLYMIKRTNNSIPTLPVALKYFKDFNDLISRSKTYNHKVLQVKKLNTQEDTYDLTIDPWHNFLLDAGIFVHNSLDGDPPAHMRYTEAKMQSITVEMLQDIDKETVEFSPNFDASEREPNYLPAKLPNLLLMGSEGIAVGMATKIPPHNLTEVVDAVIAMIAKTKIVKEPNISIVSEITIDQLMEFVKGPDFPTKGAIYDIQEVKNLYTTGKGKILMRGKADIEEIGNGKSAIIITELPYQVNKALLVARIAELAKDKKIEGISDLRDESDRHGLRVVIELKRDAAPKKVLNNLFKYTSLQTTFAANVVALVDGTPQTLNLKTILEEYLKHRFIVVTRRSEYELKQAKARLHILEGLKIAVDHIDAVIKTIRESKDQEDAKQNLMSKFKLSEIQAIAILDMQLRRLAALERQKIEDELLMVKETIEYLEDLLSHTEKVLKVVKEELVKLKEKYGDPRRTRVYKGKVDEFSEEDLIPNEPTVITITATGYIKRQSTTSFQTQNRGGKGVKGMTTKEEDDILNIRYAQAHDFLLFFTNKGKVYQLRAFEIAEGNRTSKGTAIVNLLNIEQDEKIESFINYEAKSPAKYVFLTTRNGTVKKSKISEFDNIRKSGIVAIKLDKGDELVWSNLTTGDDDILLVTKEGKAIRFSGTEVRSMGRATTGVRGIKLSSNDEVISMDVINKEDKTVMLLTIMENGLGKKTAASEFRGQTRGGMGVKVANVTDKTGKVATAQILPPNCKSIIMTSKKGQVVQLDVNSIPKLSRATQGVILMRFSKTNDHIASATCIEE